MPSPERAIGRARTVVTFGGKGHATAAVCTILANVQPAASGARVSTRGVIQFDAALVDHVERQVLPVVDAIADNLSPAKEPWTVELAARNLGVASLLDVGAAVTGFSADAAVFLAVLSARLGVAVRQDVMTSGHLASHRGDIGPVCGLPEKFAAAAADRSVDAYIIASLSSDPSPERMLPATSEHMTEAVSRARRDFRVVEVSDVGQLIRQAFDDESIVLGSLKSGFFDRANQATHSATPIDSAIQFLSSRHDERFWGAVERHAFATDAGRLQLLLSARAAFHIGQGRYPRGFGSRLHAFVRSLPATIRRRTGLFPLLPAERCLALCRLAQPDDLEDVQELLLASSGKACPPFVDQTRSVGPAIIAQDPGIAALLTDISAETLARKIDAPIDTARGVFVLERITADSDEEFWDTIRAFYVTVLRHTGSHQASGDSPVVQGEYVRFLAEAFAREGGLDAAREEARHPTRGGMRYVLDTLTDHLKEAQRSDHVRAAVAQAFDSRDWPATVAFMGALLEHLRPCLPPDLAVESPAQLVPRCAEILLTYVRSRDHVTRLIRSL